MEPEKRIETFLEVGNPVALQYEVGHKWAPRYPSCIRGWQMQKAIFVDRPKAGKRFVPVRDDQECIIRFLHDGNAIAFVSTVLRADTMTENAYCHIAWPSQVEVVPFRRFERASISLPCQLHVNDETHAGEIRDLSAGGCGVFSSVYIPETTAIHLTFSLPIGVHLDRIAVTTRNVRPEADGHFLGFEFDKGQEHVRADLTFFVKLLLKGQKEWTPNHPRVLIIDQDKSQVTGLQEDFQSNGCDVFVAENLVDGIQRLHLYNPHALLIGHQQRGIPGEDFARMLRATEALASFPIFLYGMDHPMNETQAKEAGIDCCFESVTASARICSTVVGRIARDLADGRGESAR